jgi:predicted homoserine dehydrogenase-like protein
MVCTFRLGVDDLPHILRPRSDGGILAQKGMVEVVSSIERDGRPVFRDLRWGVYAVFEAPSKYVMDCFQQYGLKTDSTGKYAAMYKPYHLIGLELGISVASIAVRQEATGLRQVDANRGLFATECLADWLGAQHDSQARHCGWRSRDLE